MAKRQKTRRFSIRGWDAKHYRTTDAYARAVQSLYDKATDAIARVAARSKVNPDKPFELSDYPAVKAEVQRITNQLAERMTTVIETGSRKQWLFACDKNDGFISSIMDTSKLSKARLKKMQDRNLDALHTFQGRKVAGLDLSQRVWKYVDQYKAQIESALDVGLGEGRSADELSRDVRANLREPNRLFRRVRDKRGNLVLSKAAAAYHPGRGVYRSSYKNAMRLTRSEINMAYRESDYKRWQQLDFVVGFEIHRSNHEPLCKCDICANLVGRYPKTFKFVGWHPQCMCYMTPILMDEDTFEANELGDLKAALRGTEYKHQQAKNVVTEMPKGFNDWVKGHVDRQKNWSSTPYFIRDNFVDGSLAKGLKITMPTVTATGKVDTHVPFEQLSNEERDRFNREMVERVDADWDLVNACETYGIDAAWYERTADEIADNHQYWRLPELNAARDRLKAQLLAKIAEVRKLAVAAIDQYEAETRGASEWIGDVAKVVTHARSTLEREASEQYPNYQAVLNWAQHGSLNPSKVHEAVEAAKRGYYEAIDKAKACVKKCGGQVDVTSLRALIDEPRSAARNARIIATDIDKEVANVERLFNESQRGMLAEVIDQLEERKIEHRPVAAMEEQLTTEQIVAKIAGGDTTKGSCASVGLAYVANRGGLDVLDFRGGDSLDYFSNNGNLRRIVMKCGGIHKDYASGVDMMQLAELDKEYYLAIGKHASVVRRVDKRKYEYMELQSPKAGDNGWQPLDSKVFGWRFGAYGRVPDTYMTEVSNLYNEPSFRDMVGYLNTEEDKQNKGEMGAVK